jgi:hypothetical protein
MNLNLCVGKFETEPTRMGDVVRPAQVVALADGPGPYSGTFPSKNPYTPVARHNRQVNLLFLMENAQSFAGEYIACSVGDPGREDVRWRTGTVSDAGAAKYRGRRAVHAYCSVLTTE